MPEATSRAMQSEETRAKIIESATDLFLKKGFYATSIAGLSKAVGLTKGALYHHFESKGAILIAVVESIKLTWRRYVGREAAVVKDPVERISRLLESHARFLEKNESFCLVLNGLATEMEGIDPEYQAIVQSGYSDMARFIERILKEGQDAGGIRSDIDPEIAALAIVGMLRGTGCVRPLSEKMKFDYIDTMSVIEKLITRGLRA